MEYLIYILNGILLFGLSYLFYFKNRESKIIHFFWIGLIYKLCMTIFVGFYYEIGDSWRIFKYTENMNGIYELDSFSSYWKMIFLNEFKSDYWKMGTVYWGNPRALFLMKIVSLLNILTFKNYWLTSFYLSLFSYFGTFYLLKNITAHYKKLKTISIFVLLFLPSVVFNSSGIIKESLAFGSICFIIGYAILINLKAKKNNIWLSIGLLTSVLLLYKLKFYYLAVLFPAIFIYLFLNFLKQINHKRKILVLLFGVIILGGIIHSLSHINPLIHPDNILNSIKSNYLIGKNDSLNGSYINFIESESPLNFCIINSPKALLYGLFGPFIWESKNAPMFYIGLENLVLLIGFLYAIYYSFKEKVKFSALGWSLIFYILILAIILPLSTPNFGTLMRYKISYLPFLFIIVFRNSNFAIQLISKFLNLFDIRK